MLEKSQVLPENGELGFNLWYLRVIDVGERLCRQFLVTSKVDLHIKVVTIGNLLCRHTAQVGRVGPATYKEIKKILTFFFPQHFLTKMASKTNLPEYTIYQYVC